MFKTIAKKFAKHIVPMIIQEVVILLEEFFQTDLNNNNKIGE
jgi:hypothetical protein